MKKIDLATYRQTLASATVIERDAYGEKVLLLPDGNLVKIFRRKRWLSSALFFPYAKRFIKNARRLSEIPIPTLTVQDVCFCRATNRHLVTYQPLPGETLRSRLRESPSELGGLLTELADFIALLHRNGVYFRSVHFGNIIVMPDRQGLGLIDVADMIFKRRTLTVGERSRNFRHMLRYPEDSGFLREFGWEKFVRHYLNASLLSVEEQGRLSGELVCFPEFSLETSNK